MNKKHHHSRNILLPSLGRGRGRVRKVRRGFFLLCSLLACSVLSSQPRPITLEEAILTARTQSVDAAVALNELKTAYWEYRSYKADLLPEMSLSGTIPAYNKRYNTYHTTVDCKPNQLSALDNINHPLTSDTTCNECCHKSHNSRNYF